MAIHISKIEINNYRSCKKTGVNLHRSLSALIGANGSGKSNFLNGILLLRKIARTPRQIVDEDFTLSSCKIRADFVIDKKSLPLEVSIKYNTNERNVDEVISTSQAWNFKDFTGEDKRIRLPISSLANFRQLPLFAESKPKEISDDKWNVLIAQSYQYLAGSSEPLEPDKVQIIYSVFEKIWGFITGISYYSASQFTDPSRCPTYFEIEKEKGLRRTNRTWNEHLQFMYDLYLASKNRKSEFQEFLSIVGKDGIGLIDTIKYDDIEVPSNIYEVAVGGKVISREVKRLLVIPNFLLRGYKLSPNQLSEGTFKTLAIIFYLVTDKSRLLLLEEPEVCVHHGLLASTLELIKTFSLKKQIVISTHSDFILDGIEPENVFVVRNEADKGTVIKHVPSSMSAKDYKALREYLNTSGNLGEYWRHGELEK